MENMKEGIIKEAIRITIQAVKATKEECFKRFDYEDLPINIFYAILLTTVLRAIEKDAPSQEEADRLINTLLRAKEEVNN